MSTEQTAIDQADFDEMSMIAEQHTKKVENVICSDVMELEEARARIIELEAHCEIFMDMARSHKQSFMEDGYLNEAVQIQELIDSTPAQSLIEVKAKAIEDAQEAIEETWFRIRGDKGTSEEVNLVRRFLTYANKLRNK